MHDDSLADAYAAAWAQSQTHSQVATDDDATEQNSSEYDEAEPSGYGVYNENPGVAGEAASGGGLDLLAGERRH